MLKTYYCWRCKIPISMLNCYLTSFRDWESEPIIDWSAAMRRFDREAEFEVAVPVIPHEQTLEEERLAMDKWKDENKEPWWKRLFS